MKKEIQNPDINKIFRSLQLLNNLKHIRRSGPNLAAGIPNMFIESLAEHSYRVTYLCMIFSRFLPNIDNSKVMQFCLTHDWGESVVGDLPTSSPSFKNYFDEDIRVIYKHAEFNVLNEIFNDLNLEHIELTEEERDLFDFCDILDLVLELIDLKQLGLRHTWLDKMFKVQMKRIDEYDYPFLSEVIEKCTYLFQQGSMENEYFTKKTDSQAK